MFVCVVRQCDVVRWITTSVCSQSLPRLWVEGKIDYPPFSALMQPLLRMNLFNWLLVAHLIADWLLQNDWMARNKQRCWLNLAIFVHCTIYTVVLVGAFALGLRGVSIENQLGFAAIILVSHWLIDAGDWATQWMLWMRQSQTASVRMMVDQTMHVLVIAALTWWFQLV